VVEGGCPTLTSGGWRSSAHHSHIYRKSRNEKIIEITVISSCYSKKVSITIRNITSTLQFGKEKEEPQAIFATNRVNVSRYAKECYGKD